MGADGAWSRAAEGRRSKTAEGRRPGERGCLCLPSSSVHLQRHQVLGALLTSGETGVSTLLILVVSQALRVSNFKCVCFIAYELHLWELHESKACRDACLVSRGLHTSSAPGPFVLSHKEWRPREPHAGAGRGRQPVWGVAMGPQAEHQSVCPDVPEVPTGTWFPQRL